MAFSSLPPLLPATLNLLLEREPEARDRLAKHAGVAALRDDTEQLTKRIERLESRGK